jgi:hypothetical protein
MQDQPELVHLAQPEAKCSRLELRERRAEDCRQVVKDLYGLRNVVGPFVHSNSFAARAAIEGVGV